MSLTDELQGAISNKHDIAAVLINPKWFHELMQEQEFANEVRVDLDKGFNVYKDLTIIITDQVERWEAADRATIAQQIGNHLRQITG